MAGNVLRSAGRVKVPAPRVWRAPANLPGIRPSGSPVATRMKVGPTAPRRWA